tara:strand:+ start:76 stop:1227 length:1152 start_codon:yes stop_codon:yes gene_type:complete
MGAGTTLDHYIQDAGEIYVVYKIQHNLEWLGMTTELLSGKKWNDFINYCNHPSRNMLKKFRESDYCEIIDKHIDDFTEKLTEKYKMKMTVKNTEVENRNNGKKGDFTIDFEDSTSISVSLKVYKKGYHNIQLCSGTWTSFLNNFYFEKAGSPGMYLNEDKKKFKGSDKETRDKEYEKIGKSEIIPILDEIDKVNQYLKETYIESEKTEFYTREVETMWREDCKKYGTMANISIKEALEKLGKDVVKEKILKMGDIYNDEDILLMGPDSYTFNQFDDKYNNFTKRICSSDSNLKLISKGQSLIFNFYDNKGDIVNISVPFTFNKNGAWLNATKWDHWNPGTDNEKKFHKKEGILLSNGQRRPKKSKELATSTNMWMCIKGNYTL